MPRLQVTAGTPLGRAASPRAPAARRPCTRGPSSRPGYRSSRGFPRRPCVLPDGRELHRPVLAALYLQLLGAGHRQDLGVHALPRPALPTPPSSISHPAIEQRSGSRRRLAGHGRRWSLYRARGPPAPAVRGLRRRGSYESRHGQDSQPERQAGYERPSHGFALPLLQPSRTPARLCLGRRGRHDTVYISNATGRVSTT